jgi:hypothetical protein
MKQAAMALHDGRPGVHMQAVLELRNDQWKTKGPWIQSLREMFMLARPLAEAGVLPIPIVSAEHVLQEVGSGQGV